MSFTLQLDEEDYRIGLDDDYGDIVPYGEAAVLIDEDEGRRYVSLVVDPNNPDHLVVYELVDSGLSPIVHRAEAVDVSFDDEQIDVEDEADGT